MPDTIWPSISDEALVERLIPAVQRTIAEETFRHAAGVEGGMAELSAPDVANVLLLMLATVLELSPQCSTARGMRTMSEAAGKELALLMRETREVKLADQRGSGTVQ